MIWVEIKGRCEQWNGSVKEQWAKLTDDLATIAARRWPHRRSLAPIRSRRDQTMTAQRQPFQCSKFAGEW